MSCRWIYVRAALSVVLVLSAHGALLWFYFRRVRPFVRKWTEKILG